MLWTIAIITTAALGAWTAQVLHSRWRYPYLGPFGSAPVQLRILSGPPRSQR